MNPPQLQYMFSILDRRSWLVCAAGASPPCLSGKQPFQQLTAHGLQERLKCTLAINPSIEELLPKVLFSERQPLAQPLPSQIMPYQPFLQSHAHIESDDAEALGSQELPAEAMAICANNGIITAKRRGAVMQWHR